jgi:hypothetical protein
MKKRLPGFLLAAMLALGATGCATFHHSEGWKYKVVVVGGDMYAPHHVPMAEQTINTMTQRGWHLVSVSAAGAGPQVFIVFKKHK